MDVGIKAAWSQVENQLQRRYDLIPNLVETVKGYAKQEKDVLVEVTNAVPRLAGPERFRIRSRPIMNYPAR